MDYRHGLGAAAGLPPFRMESLGSFFGPLAAGFHHESSWNRAADRAADHGDGTGGGGED